MTEPLSPVQRAFLNSIAAGESPGYDVIYGGQRFQDYTDHPRVAVPIKSGPNVGKTSSAAGRYQFLGSTWDEAKSALGLPDFSPDSQDRAAAWLAERDYKKRTGRGLWADVEGAAGDPAKLDQIGSSLSGTWTSLPNGIERNRATSGFGQRVATELSAQSRNSSPTAWGAVAVEDSPSAWGAVPVDAGGGQSRPAEKGKAGFWDTYSGMVNESVDQFKTGVGQVKEAVVGDYAPATLLKGVGNVVAGGLGYAGAVPNAAIRTYGSQPLEDTTGIPKEVTELALAVTPWGPKRVPGAPSVKMAPSAPATAAPRIPPVMPG
jgi:muramidase (phage lysozyme)